MAEEGIEAFRTSQRNLRRLNHMLFGNGLEIVLRGVLTTKIGHANHAIGMNADIVSQLTQFKPKAGIATDSNKAALIVKFIAVSDRCGSNHKKIAPDVLLYMQER